MANAMITQPLDMKTVEEGIASSDKKVKRLVPSSRDKVIATFVSNKKTLKAIAREIISKNILLITPDCLAVKHSTNNSRYTYRTFTNTRASQYIPSAEFVHKEIKLRYTSKKDTESLKSNLFRNLSSGSGEDKENRYHEGDHAEERMEFSIYVMGGDNIDAEFVHKDDKAVFYMKIKDSDPVYLTRIKPSQVPFEIPMSGKPLPLFHAVHMLQVDKDTGVVVKKDDSKRIDFSIPSGSRMRTFAAPKELVTIDLNTPCRLNVRSSRLFISYMVPGVDLESHIVASSHSSLKRAQESDESESEENDVEMAEGSGISVATTTPQKPKERDDETANPPSAPRKRKAKNVKEGRETDEEGPSKAKNKKTVTKCKKVGFSIGSWDKDHNLDKKVEELSQERARLVQRQELAAAISSGGIGYKKKPEMVYGLSDSDSDEDYMQA